MERNGENGRTEVCVRFGRRGHSREKWNGSERVGSETENREARVGVGDSGGGSRDEEGRRERVEKRGGEGGRVAVERGRGFLIIFTVLEGPCTGQLVGRWIGRSVWAEQRGVGEALSQNTERTASLGATSNRMREMMGLQFTCVGYLFMGIFMFFFLFLLFAGRMHVPAHRASSVTLSGGPLIKCACV